MNDLVKLEERIKAVNAAVAEIKMAIVVERSVSHDKNINNSYAKALDELINVQIILDKLKTTSKEKNT